MKPTRRKRKVVSPLVSVIAALTGFILVAPAAAQPYPNRPIQLVVAYPEGGTGEIVGRPFTEKLTTLLSQPVKLEYRPGASGA
jgi:tripartite-type tricarboxylate transporter receptor subunit TctC